VTIADGGTKTSGPVLGSSVLGRAVRMSAHAALLVIAGAVIVLGSATPLAALALAVWFLTRTIRRRRAA